MPFNIKKPDFSNALVGVERDKRQERPKPPPRMPRNTPMDTVAISDVRVTCVDGRSFQIAVESDGVLQICRRDDDSLNYIVHVCHGNHVVFWDGE